MLTVVLANESNTKENEQDKNGKKNHDDAKGEQFKPKVAAVVEGIFSENK